MSEKRSTTKVDFDAYKGYCLEWIDYFGLLDWACFFKWENLKTLDAQTVIDFECRQAIFLFDRGNVSFNLRDLAFHEVVEALLLGRLRMMALKRDATETDIKGEAHRIVMILQSVKDKKRKERNNVFGE